MTLWKNAVRMTSGKEGDQQWRLSKAKGETKQRSEKVNKKEQEMGGRGKDKRIGTCAFIHWHQYEKEELVVDFYNRHS